MSSRSQSPVILITVIWLLSGMAASSFSQTRIIHRNGAGDEHLFRIQVLEQDLTHTRIEFHIHGYETEKTSHGNVIQIPGMITLQQPGAPDLPVLYRVICIPDRVRLSHRIIAQTVTVIDGFDVAPSGGSVVDNSTDRPIRVRGEAYFRDGRFPESIFELYRPGIARDVHLVKFRFSPVQYNPVRRQATVTTHLLVDILYEEEIPSSIRLKSRGGIKRKAPAKSDVFMDLYPKLFMNFDPEFLSSHFNPLAIRENDEIAGDRMIIITLPEYGAELGDYIRWKQDRGIDVELDITSAAGGADAVKQKLKAKYDEEGLTYIVLIGDIEQVPSPRIFEDFSDPLYALLDGDDYWADALVSRIPASDVTQLRNQINKTLIYEKGEFTATDWINRAILAYYEVHDAELDYDSTVETDLIESAMKSNPWHFHEVIRIMESDPNGRNRFLNAVEGLGANIIMYNGHGSPWIYRWLSFTVDDVNRLNIEGKGFPFLFTGGCHTGRFSLSGEDCMAEAWMKLGTVERPAGAIAVRAGYTYLSGYPVNLAHKAAFTDLYYLPGAQTIGALCHYSSIAAMQQVSDEQARAFYQCWHLFGDCSTILWKNLPPALRRELTVIIPDSVVAMDAVLTNAGRVLSSQTAETDMTVNLTSSDPTRIVVVPSVVIPAGQAHTTFDLTIIGQHASPGTENVIITASADEFQPGEMVISIIHRMPTLTQNYPNPFNMHTTFRFEHYKTSKVSIGIYDIQGRKVRIFSDREMEAGIHAFFWDGRDDRGRPMASGEYFCKIRMKGFTETKKLLLLR